MKSVQDPYILNNGTEIPCVGFGTWETPDGETAIECVRLALTSGYRHIDTAAVYGNEKSVGEGIKQAGLPREQVFVTSKVWNRARGYDQTLKAFETSLNDLQLDYLDLYLIHWPAARGEAQAWQRENHDTWRALERLYEEGAIKAIGVSNFLPHHLQPLLAKANIKPLINQIEFHPGYMQEEAVAFCRAEGILVEAWSPLGRGKVLAEPLLVEIATKYGKSPAQVCVRWCLQHQTLPLPKSVTPSRIVENMRVFDFELSAADMAAIDALPETGWSGLHPDKNNF